MRKIENQKLIIAAASSSGLIVAARSTFTRMCGQIASNRNPISNLRRNTTTTGALMSKDGNKTPPESAVAELEEF